MKFTDHELELMFEESLDDCVELIKIGSLTYLPSYVLKNVDPVVYRCWLGEWLDAQVSDEIIHEHSDGSYHDEPEEIAN